VVEAACRQLLMQEDVSRVDSFSSFANRSWAFPAETLAIDTWTTSRISFLRTVLSVGCHESGWDGNRRLSAEVNPIAWENVPTASSPGLPEHSLSELIDHIEKGLQVPFGKRLADRIRYLVAVSREEYPDQAPPEASSLMGLIKLLQIVPGLTCPDVVLTPEGNVRAQWRGSKNQNFALEFLNDEDVRFVVLAPDRRRPYKTLRAAGLATVDGVMELMRPYRVLDWAEAVDGKPAP
jgi:hypothetical protein